jgi:hypothetical protein
MPKAVQKLRQPSPVEWMIRRQLFSLTPMMEVRTE